MGIVDLPSDLTDTDMNNTIHPQGADFAVGDRGADVLNLGGKCRRPMWISGSPAGFCDAAANGPQLPLEVLRKTRGWNDAPYCFGPCCPDHGGPRNGEPIVFQDGRTPEGRPMWCAVMPGFRNLQEDAAGFHANPNIAISELSEELARCQGTPA
jgi:hypothetical protein